MKKFFAVLSLLMSIGCRSAGTVTLAVTSADPSHTGVPVYLELRDPADRRVAMTSARLAASVPLELRLPRVLDGGRYHARWWLDLDGDGAPSTAAAGAEPAFAQTLGGTSDLTLWYSRGSWETPAETREAAIPPFCQRSACGPTSVETCESGEKCFYSAAALEWMCCRQAPYDQ